MTPRIVPLVGDGSYHARIAAVCPADGANIVLIDVLRVALGSATKVGPALMIVDAEDLAMLLERATKDGHVAIRRGTRWADVDVGQVLS